MDSTSSLRASTVRELTGLYSKKKHYVSSLTAGGGLFPNVSEACQNAILGLRGKPELGKCKYLSSILKTVVGVCFEDVRCNKLRATGNLLDLTIM